MGKRTYLVIALAALAAALAYFYMRPATQAPPPEGPPSAEARLKELERAAAKDPDNPQVYIDKGYQLHTMGLYSDAVADYDRALMLDPKSAQAHYIKGRAFAELGRPEAALESFGRASELDPEHPKPVFAKGMALYGLGRYDEALSAFDKAAALDPGNASAHAYRAASLLRLGRASDALASAEKAVGIDPGNPAAQTMKGECLLRLGRGAEAVEPLMAALVVDGTSRPARVDLACALLERKGRGDAEKAGEMLGAVVSEDPSDIEAARAYALMGKKAEMLSALDAALKAAPKSAGAIGQDPAFSAYKGDGDFRARAGKRG